MPVKRTKSKRSRKLSENRIVALLEGPERNLLGGFDDYFTCNIHDIDSQPQHVKDAAYAEMRRDWEAHREELMAYWNAGPDEADPFYLKPWNFVARGGPSRLPWAAIQFDPQPIPAHLKKDLK